MMNSFIAFIIIVAMTLCSKFLRQIAFGRSDSIALEASICSFLYNLIYVANTFNGFNDFLEKEALRFIILLIFPFVIAIVHHYYKDICIQKIRSMLERLQTKKDCGNSTSASDDQTEDALIQNTELIARQSIDVWYSQFVDAMFYGILKKVDKSDEKSFRKKKSLVRWAFADIINTLPVMRGEKKFDDKDFNIESRDQIIGMIIFDVMQALAVIVAIRLI